MRSLPTNHQSLLESGSAQCDGHLSFNKEPRKGLVPQRATGAVAYRGSLPGAFPPQNSCTSSSCNSYLCSRHLPPHNQAPTAPLGLNAVPIFAFYTLRWYITSSNAVGFNVILRF
jgi:hypothetical protein